MRGRWGIGKERRRTACSDPERWMEGKKGGEAMGRETHHPWTALQARRLSLQYTDARTLLPCNITVHTLKTQRGVPCQLEESSGLWCGVWYILGYYLTEL